MRLTQHILSATAGLFALVGLSASAHADFTVTGSFLYQDREFSFTGGFTGNEPSLPIRLAKVQVIDASTSAILASGATDASGQVSLFVSATGTADVLVRCFARSTAFGSKTLRVTNNSNAVYSVSSNTFAGHNLSTNLDFGTVTSLKLTSGANQGSPFNMLDQMVWCIQYIKASGGKNPAQALRMKWPGGGGSFASGTTATIADSDGYDDIVQLHELGHIIHNVYSDSDNVGGTHGFGESDQDPRLSFGEGWASFFAGAVRQHAGLFDPGFYMDAKGNGSTGSGSIQLRMRYENGFPFAGTTGGEADEGAIHCALWDIVDHVNTNDKSPGTDDDGFDGSLFFGGLSADAAQWKVFIGPVKSAANLTIRNFWDGWFVPIDHTGQTQLEAILDGWKMRFFEDADEPNQTQQSATPITPSSAFGATKTLYYTTAPVGAPGAGDSDYYSFSVTAGKQIDIETRYPDGKNDAETYADVRLELYRPNGSLFASDNNSGVGRNALISGLTADSTGTWAVRVFSTHIYRKTGSYQLRVETTGTGGGNLAISGVAPLQTEAIIVDGSTSVTLTGTGFLGVTSVKVDGVSLLSFPPMYTIVDDTTITFAMPTASSLGPIPIELSGTTGAAQSSINVVANAVPTLELKNSDPGFLFQALGLQLTAAGAPGDIAFILASPDLLPTALPGIIDVDLAIGNGYTSLFILASPLIGAPGYTKVTIPLSGLTPGFQVHVQSAQLLLSTLYALPAVASNVQSGTILF